MKHFFTMLFYTFLFWLTCAGIFAVMYSALAFLTFEKVETCPQQAASYASKKGGKKKHKPKKNKKKSSCPTPTKPWQLLILIFKTTVTAVVTEIVKHLCKRVLGG